MVHATGFNRRHSRTFSSILLRVTLNSAHQMRFLLTAFEAVTAQVEHPGEYMTRAVPLDMRGLEQVRPTNP